MKEESDESSGENLHDSKTFKGHNQKWRPSHSEYQFAKEHNRDPKWRQWAHPSPTQAAWASESQTQGCREDPCPEPWRPASQGIKERTKGGRRDLTDLHLALNHRNQHGEGKTQHPDKELKMQLIQVYTKFIVTVNKCCFCVWMLDKSTYTETAD